MARKFLTGTMLICALTFGSGAAFAQSASDEAKKAGKAAEKVGKDTAEATEHASKAAAKTAKKTSKVIKKADIWPSLRLDADSTRSTRTAKGSCPPAFAAA